MKYYVILSKQAFTSLYRFGTTPINAGDLNSANSDLIDYHLYNAFLNLPYFNGDEEYLILLIEKTNANRTELSIEEVIEVIPLTPASQKSFQMKFDTRIEFSSPKFLHVVEKVEKLIELNDKIKGAQALWKLFDIKTPFTRSLIDEEVIEKSYDTRLKGTSSAGIHQDFYTHLLVYERYEFFPMTDSGYLYDIGEVLAHSNGKPTFKGTSFYSFLEANKEKYKSHKLSDLLKNLENSAEAERFREILSKNGIRRYIVAALFLFLKSEFLKTESIDEMQVKDIVDYVNDKTDYQKEFEYATFLTGIFFGYKKFYSDLYLKINIPIFRRQSSLNITNKISSNNGNIKETGNNASKKDDKESNIKPDHKKQTKPETQSPKNPDNLSTKKDEPEVTTRKDTEVNKLEDKVKPENGSKQSKNKKSLKNQKANSQLNIEDQQPEK